eukprot:4831049-Heterocapsa_arctica.AAC.1
MVADGLTKDIDDQEPRGGRQTHSLWHLRSGPSSRRWRTSPSRPATSRQRAAWRRRYGRTADSPSSR